MHLTKLNLFIFTHVPKQNPPPGSYHNHPEQRFLYFSPAERGEDYGAEKLPKLNLRGYWSQVLINSTISVTFKFLAFVLLYHNLD